MQAMILILAAGMGKRLQKYTQDQTKCMIRVAVKTLLEHACDALKAAGIHKVILVVGSHGAEREYLMKRLEAPGFLKVYPSQTNYVMCGVAGVSSRELANMLIDKYNIPIKDLSTKLGFEGRQYIRIAIMCREENEFLLKALAWRR